MVRSHVVKTEDLCCAWIFSVRWITVNPKPEIQRALENCFTTEAKKTSKTFLWVSVFPLSLFSSLSLTLFFSHLSVCLSVSFRPRPPWGETCYLSICFLPLSFCLLSLSLSLSFFFFSLSVSFRPWPKWGEAGYLSVCLRFPFSFLSSLSSLPLFLSLSHLTHCLFSVLCLSVCVSFCLSQNLFLPVTFSFLSLSLRIIFSEHFLYLSFGTHFNTFFRTERSHKLCLEQIERGWLQFYAQIRSRTCSVQKPWKVVSVFFRSTWDKFMTLFSTSGTINHRRIRCIWTWRNSPWAVSSRSLFLVFCFFSVYASTRPYFVEQNDAPVTSEEQHKIEVRLKKKLLIWSQGSFSLLPTSLVCVWSPPMIP